MSILLNRYFGNFNGNERLFIKSDISLDEFLDFFSLIETEPERADLSRQYYELKSQNG